MFIKCKKNIQIDQNFHNSNAIINQLIKKHYLNKRNLTTINQITTNYNKQQNKTYIKIHYNLIKYIQKIVEFSRKTKFFSKFLFKNLSSSVCVKNVRLCQQSMLPVNRSARVVSVTPVTRIVTNYNCQMFSFRFNCNICSKTFNSLNATLKKISFITLRKNFPAGKLFAYIFPPHLTFIFLQQFIELTFKQFFSL